MKRLTLLLLLSTAAINIPAYSQIGNSKPAATLENSNYIFCELVQQERFIGSPGQETTIFMNYGKKSNYKNRFDENSYVRQQKDVVDALNHLGENGWELVFKNIREMTNGIESVYILKRKAG